MTEKRWWLVIGGILILQFALWPLVVNSNVSWGHWPIAGLSAAAALIVVKLTRIDRVSEGASDRSWPDA